VNLSESGAALTGAAFDGLIDVVGDVHGEIDALEDLLHVLGYRGRGDHPAGRRLVFIGDLCDRGPDSPGVIRRVREMVEAGTAQCLLGNHEINVMRGSRKEANGWFYENDHDRQSRRFESSKPAAGDVEREEILAFLRSLPLVLERPDLRLVHACWSDERIAEARETAGFSNAVELYRHYAALAEARAQASGLATEAGALLDHYRERLVDRSQPVPMLEAVAERDLAYQMSNPVRVLTSGIERRAHEPFYMAGKWRMVERVEWWKTYAADTPVLFGHYWRWPTPEAGRRYGRYAHDVFERRAANEWLGPRDSAFCIDYSVGARYAERLSYPGEPFVSRLGAVRWPERELIFDDGSGAELSPRRLERS
jgi:hypothetical protein